MAWGLLACGAVRPGFLLLALVVAACCLWAAPAHAVDECDTDADCVAIYTAGYRCVQGSLGRYCVGEEEYYGTDESQDPCAGCVWNDSCDGCGGWWGGSGGGECEDDGDCVDLYGENWVCGLEWDGTYSCGEHECDDDASCGPGRHCDYYWGDASTCRDVPGWSPPFRSCAVAPSSGGHPGPALTLAALLGLLLRRRRA